MTTEFVRHDLAKNPTGTSEPDRVRVIREGVASYLPDIDPEETAEWLESFDALLERSGPSRARYLMLRLLERAGEQRVALPALTSTDYVNTIPTESEPFFPGDEEIERRYRGWIRWNAAIMVHRAQRPGVGVGGHISTYASSAALYEVGFNHFFRGKSHPGGGDQVFIQGHASPGIYARAFLEGRLTTDQLDGFRQEHSHPGGGLPSYPHPRLMPDFWEFPTVSMGLGPMNAIYQARFNHYLHDRGIKDTSDQHVWAFLGDGEMDEPESRGLTHVAALEGLDNLTFVVNCNLQRLDGPVRGNGKIIQELESFFRGAGWNVIKVVWGREWDALLHADRDGALVNLMNTTPDGDYQTYKANDGAYVRDHFFGRDPRTKALVEQMTDAEFWNLKRGGHDYRKVYAAYRAATEHKGQPTVILAKTIKGYSLCAHFQGRNATHQMKKLALQDLQGLPRRHPNPDQRRANRARQPLPCPRTTTPAPEALEIRYLLERRHAPGRKLRTSSGAPKPRRAAVARSRGIRSAEEGLRPPGSGHHHGHGAYLQRTVARQGNWPADRPDHPRRGTHLRDGLVVPVAEDLQPQRPALHRCGRRPHAGLQGKSNRPDHARGHQRSRIGRLVHRGAHLVFDAQRADDPDLPHLRFDVRISTDRGRPVGRRRPDGTRLFARRHRWAHHADLRRPAARRSANHRCKAATNPAVLSYDPAFAFEIAYIIESGLARMFGENAENIFYYITIYNEPYVQPPEPENFNTDGVLRGIYRYRPATESRTNTADILASGVAMPAALRASEMLAAEWDVAADVWSVTSWSELNRDGVAIQKERLRHPDRTAGEAYVTRALSTSTGPFIAVSDWMRAVPEQIRPWVPGSYVTAGHRRVRLFRHPAGRASILPNTDRRIPGRRGAGRRWHATVTSIRRYR